MTIGANRLLPGIPHAPGVLCMIAVKHDRPDAKVNNGKLVILREKYKRGRIFNCPGCVAIYQANADDIWEFEAVVGVQLVAFCYPTRIVSREQLQQKFLIPLGDGTVAGDLLLEQLKEELIKSVRKVKVLDPAEIVKIRTF